MAHKHNRRRIRPRSRNHGPSPTSCDGILSSSGLTDSGPAFTPRANKTTFVPQYNRLTDLSAQHWHNRYNSWQTRERQRRQEEEVAAKLEADQCRLFGGEPGDDIPDAYHDDGCLYDLTETTVGRNEGRGGYNSLKIQQPITRTMMTTGDDGR